MKHVADLCHLEQQFMQCCCNKLCMFQEGDVVIPADCCCTGVSQQYVLLWEGHPVLGFFFLVGVRTAHVVWAACVKSVRFGRAPLQQRVPQLLLIEFWLCKRIIRLSVASVVEQLCTCKVVSCTFLS